MNLPEKPGQKGLITSSRIQSLVDRAKSIGTVAIKDDNSAGSFLEICIAGDSTGSMHPVFKAAQTAVKEILTTLYQEEVKARMAFVAYKNHGDESYFDNEKAFVSTCWETSPDPILDLMGKIPNGGGGDGLTVLEDVLFHIAEMDWQNDSSKVLVIIGDMPPHGVLDSIKRCPKKIDYKQQVEKLKAKGVKIYSIFCRTHSFLTGSKKIQKIEEFYESIAQTTGGKCLSLEDVQMLITILLGISIKEAKKLDDDFIERITKLRSLPASHKQALLALKS